MYEAPAGVRSNMNPPQFQLLMRPLTAFSLSTADAIFRALSVASLALCVGWLWWWSRDSAEPWGIGDLGALLAWAPMASVIALNEVTWLLWPLILYTWSSWRRQRWTPGAIAFGIALSLKPFLGVFLLWLLVTRRWRAAASAVAAGLAMYGIAALAYGVRVFPAWWLALDSVRWWWAPMNASLQGLIARTAAPSGAMTAAAPSWAGPLTVALDVGLVAAALVRARSQTVDESWTLLMLSALLASPLGWIYYIWWVVPGVRPVRLLFRSPLLWVPYAFVSVQPPNRLIAATLASMYFWGLFLLWLGEFRSSREEPSRSLAAQ
jgi:alpha-1,2-mannosyltransferase